MNPKVSVAIVGLGAVVRNIHIPAYAQLGQEVQIAAGCDPDREARQFAREKLGVPAVFESAAEMIKQTKPDVVAVCTPPSLHCEHTLLSLSHGCHVFCEKPFALSLDQADEMILAGERAGRLVVINNQFPYMKIHTAAKSLIGSPDFGRLLHVHAWHTMHPVETHKSGWRNGGSRGLCFEFGVHVFELIRYFFEAEPSRIFAHMPKTGRTLQADMVNMIALEFSDGRAASLSLDRLSRGPERYLNMRLDGESGAIETSIGGRIRFAAGLHTRERRPFVEFRVVQGGQAVLQSGNRERVIGTDKLNPFATATTQHFRSFIQAVRNGGTPPGSARDNRKTLQLVLAAYESAETGRWVAIGNSEEAHAVRAGM